MKLLNWLEIDYKVIEKKLITEHVVSVNLWLSDIEIVVKTFEWEDEDQIIQNNVAQFVRQAFPKIDQEIKEIEDKEYAEVLAKKESNNLIELENIAKEEKVEIYEESN